MNTEQILAPLGISELTPMQTETYDAIAHTNNDVAILSPTGTGKTLAYLLPLAEMLDEGNDSVQALVVVPGRELALQSHEVMKRMGTNLKSFAAYGGRPTMDEHRQIRQLRPQIVFGTPGRLCDHLQKGNIAADNISMLILDEFDKCLEMGFQTEMETLLGLLPNLKRRILLSATNSDALSHFVSPHHTATIDYLPQADERSQRINIYKVCSPEKDKLESLRQLLLSLGSKSTIVFLNYRQSVERTTEYLSQRGFSVVGFHGGLDQRQREDALYQFANGSVCILVSTDLGSRGLDIPDVENIIHYHLPETPENYTHRIGRTARWDKQGRAFFLLAPGEQLPAYVDPNIEQYTPQPADNATPQLPLNTTLYMGKGKKDKISRGDIVGFLCKIAQLDKQDIGRIDVRDYYSYVAVKRGKAKQVMQLSKGQKIKGIRTIWEEIKR